MPIPNYDGVYITSDASDNVIGGMTSGTGDVISGNTEDGVHIVYGAAYNQVEGSYIGLSASGSSALGNGASGVAIYGGASNNLIGGSVSGAGDVVSGNVGDGLYISDGGTNANVVEGDYIGTDDTGSVSVPNDLGVYLGGGTTNNTIGGMTTTARDVISGNKSDGIQMFSVGTAGNVVEGDYIGLTAAGGAGAGNSGNGVSLYAGANNNLIGGTSSGNVISYNGGNGVCISGTQTVGNVVAGNLIGTDPTGQNAAGNGGDGVLIEATASWNTIGGATSGFGNIISANGGNGVQITGAGTEYNVVAGNTIGSSLTGSFILGNGGNGVQIDSGATYNTIGGTTSSAGNVIEFNKTYGIELESAGTSDNTIEYDTIGSNTDADVYFTQASANLVTYCTIIESATQPDGIVDPSNANSYSNNMVEVMAASKT